LIKEKTGVKPEFNQLTFTITITEKGEDK